MAFSFSQTSFMALAAGVWVLELPGVAAASSPIAAGLAVLLVAVGVAISQPQVVDALNHSLDKASSSRASLAERGSETFGAHPVAGVGLGGFGAATGKTDFEKRHIAPHNIVVDVASELGIVGIGLFLALLTTIAVALRRVPSVAAARDPRRRPRRAARARARLRPVLLRPDVLGHRGDRRRVRAATRPGGRGRDGAGRAADAHRRRR